MEFYSVLYRPIQNLISFLLKKKNFKTQLCNYLSENRYEEIHDIGCSDGMLASIINLKKIKYFGYDIDYVNIKKANDKFKYDKNIKFYNKSIEQVNINNKNKKIFILTGVFHHVSDAQILKFLKNLASTDHVIAIDPFFHKNQNLIGYLMKKMDKGKFIRDYKGYKNALSKFVFRKKISNYLRFYSHLLSFRNVKKKKIDYYFK